MSSWKLDRAKMMASQVASKGYFAGEVTGFRFGRVDGKGFSNSVQHPPDPCKATQKPPSELVSSHEVQVLKSRVAEALHNISEKRNMLTVQDLKRLLFRCAATLIYGDKVRNTSLTSCRS